VKLYFKPMPWLSLITLACLAFLIYLGNWQHRRLIWKTGLLRQIDEAANAAPLGSLAEVEERLAQNKPVDFQRIELEGEFITAGKGESWPFHLMRSDGKTYFWQLYQPFQSAGRLAFVATKKYSDHQRTNPPAPHSGPAHIVGYVRLVRPHSRFVPKSRPLENAWYAFNDVPEVLDWARVVSGKQVETRYYIDQAEGVSSASDLPVRKPELRNHHLDYMLTWYSFAFILLIIYLLIHKKAGRLGIRKTTS